MMPFALRRLRVPAAHRPPVLARAKLSGKIRELIDERAYLAVVANHQRLNLPEPEQAGLDGARGRVRHRAAVPRVELPRFADVLTVHSLRPTLHRPTPALVFEVGLRVGGDAPMQKLAFDEQIRPHAGRGRERRIRHEAASWLRNEVHISLKASDSSDCTVGLIQTVGTIGTPAAG